jgi:energy-coupling factor transporter ATP-binding protein EcfA2
METTDVTGVGAKSGFVLFDAARQEAARVELYNDGNQDEEFPTIGEDNVESPRSLWSADELDAQGTSQTATVEEEEATAVFPPQPRTLAETGLSLAFLTDLALKTIHYSGLPSATHMTERMALPSAIVQQLLTLLADDHLCEVASSSNMMVGNYRYRLTAAGINRVRDALERSRYAGPAPVTVDQYIKVMERQRGHRPQPSRQSIEKALSELVLAPDVADALARTLHSGRCALLYGPSGNGKTSVLEALARYLEGEMLVPFAIYAYGHIIRVFDSAVHIPVKKNGKAGLSDVDTGEAEEKPKRDERWTVVRRPAMVVGGELGEESLELAYDPVSRFYQAPAHLKAQGGMLAVDDFGRQRIRPEDLLSRWLTPLERGCYSLTFHTGEKISVPFDVHLLFATNLKVELLLDQPFLRRILYKVEIPNPGPNEFRTILQRACQDRSMTATEETLGYIVERLYEENSHQTRASYACDLLDIVAQSARYDNVEPALTPETFDKAHRLFIPEQA